MRAGGPQIPSGDRPVRGLLRHHNLVGLRHRMALVTAPADPVTSRLAMGQIL